MPDARWAYKGGRKVRMRTRRAQSLMPTECMRCGWPSAGLRLWLRGAQVLVRGRGWVLFIFKVASGLPLMPPQARSRRYHAGGTEGWERWTGASAIEARAPACREAGALLPVPGRSDQRGWWCDGQMQLADGRPPRTWR